MMTNGGNEGMDSSTTFSMIGYWLDRTPEVPDTGYPDPQELAGKLDASDRDAILEYLARGIPFRFYPGVAECRICGEDVGSRELTDGTWAWPEGLLHYVQAHGVALPGEFLQAARANAVPEDLADRIGEAEMWVASCGGSVPAFGNDEPRFTLDLRPWRDWAVSATQARPNSFATDLVRARRVAAELAHPSFRIAIDPVGGRWRVDFPDSAERIYVQRCSTDTLRELLLRYRYPDPEAILTPDAMRAIAAEYDGDWGAARVLASAMNDVGEPIAWMVWVRPPDGEWPTSEAVSATMEREQSFGWTCFNPDGTYSLMIRPQDEIGWRAFLASTRRQAAAGSGGEGGASAGDGKKPAGLLRRFLSAIGVGKRQA